MRGFQNPHAAPPTQEYKDDESRFKYQQVQLQISDLRATQPPHWEQRVAGLERIARLLLPPRPVRVVKRAGKEDSE